MKAGVSTLFLISRKMSVIEKVASAFSEKYPNQKCIPIAADVSYYVTQYFNFHPNTNSSLVK